MNNAIPRFSIALISASALAYEILLMRLFSIIQWHHFAYMIISLALLGYGASGTFLALAQRLLLARFAAAFISNLVLFGLTSVGCYLLAQQLPLNAEEILWEPRQALWLLTNYLLLAVPFFFAANCVALAIANYRANVGRIYAMDLIGAGMGSLGSVLLLFVVFPNQALLIIGCLGLSAGAVAWWELRLQPRAGSVLFALAAILLLAIPSSWTALNLSPYKSLPQTLHISGTNVIAEHSSPLGLLTVVESPLVPWRHAPGLSINTTGEPPPQLAVFTDGDAMTAITNHHGDETELAYLDDMTSALPYHLNQTQRVLVLGAGGGAEVLQASFHHASKIDAVELNPQMAALVQDDYASFAGNLYDSDNVQLHIDEARGFVSKSNEHYDLIQVALLDAFSASATGLHALNESYLYTVEALQDYMERVGPDGYLALTRWIKLPPRDTLKLFATAVDSLRQLGIDEPAKRLILIRGWQTSTLLIKNGEVTTDEITALRDFCQQRAFDVAYYPGINAEETNQYNILAQPYFYDAATALLSEQRNQFLHDYKFELQPATDDRPYFFHFFKWNVLEEILKLRDQGGVALLEWGYLVLLATLLQAVVVSVVLILLPLLLSRRLTDKAVGPISRLRVLGYFFAIGLAFLFIEIAFIQKFILFLHHPLYAAAVVLTAFLVFAGLGSRFSQSLAERLGNHAVLIVVRGDDGLAGTDQGQS
jgi:hypothetical protein